MNSKISPSGNATLGVLLAAYVVGILTFYLSKFGTPWALDSGLASALVGWLGIQLGHINALASQGLSQDVIDSLNNNSAPQQPVTAVANT